jgi:hypothetical protein
MSDSLAVPALPLGGTHAGEGIGFRVIAGTVRAGRCILQPLTEGRRVLFGKRQLGLLGVAGVEPRRVGVESCHGLEQRVHQGVEPCGSMVITKLGQQEIQVFARDVETYCLGHNRLPWEPTLRGRPTRCPCVDLRTVCQGSPLPVAQGLGFDDNRTRDAISQSCEVALTSSSAWPAPSVCR